MSHEEPETISLNEAALEFVAVLRNELLMPLSAIRGYTELLLSGKVGALTEEQEKFLMQIGKNEGRARKTLLGFSSLARIDSRQPAIDSQRPAIKALDLIACIEKVIKSYRREIEAKSQTLTIQCPDSLFVQVHQGELEDILSAILENASRYANVEGKIVLKVESVDRFVKVSVQDTGVGIAPEAQEHIFERFYRSSDLFVREQFGVGLSLHLAKHYVEHYGGDIGFESQQGKGSTFWFTLPVAEQLGD